MALADSALAVYQTFVGRLSAADLEQFWQEYLIVGELFGLPRQHAPVSYAEFADYMQRRLHSGELFVTPEAKSLGLRIALLVPVPAVLLPALPVADAALLAVLPKEIRRLYGIPWMPVCDFAFQSAALGARLARLFTPGLLSRGSSSREYGLVARTEASRQKLKRLYAHG